MSNCLKALINSDNLDHEENVRVVALFDNEEVGSNTAHGGNSMKSFNLSFVECLSADSNMLVQVLRRITYGVEEVVHPVLYLSDHHIQCTYCN
jgi:aspartyl aminopeptidase